MTTGPEPPLFLAGVFALFAVGALLPLDVGQRRQDYIVLTIPATVVLGLFGPRGLLFVWGAVLLAFAVRRGSRWLVGTAAAITVGASLAHPTFTWLLDRDYPMRLAEPGDMVVAWAVMVVAWCGTMSVRVVLHRISSATPLRDSPDAFDAFDSPLVPYLWPVVAGTPIVAASVALYRETDPWGTLALLLWCLPVYAACRFELHRQRLAVQLRRAAESRQRLAAIGEVTARIVHQSRHQAGLMGWSLHRLRRLVGDASPEAVAAARRELDVLAEAKQRIQETLDHELVAEPPAEDAGPTTLAAVVRAVCAQLADKARRRGVAIEVDVDAAAGSTTAGSALREALFNVVDNASDAAVSRVRVAVPSVSAPDELVVEVSDDGAGIPADAAGRLYEPFFSTKPDGSGMGLAIADALVAELGGQLRHDRRDSTTTFRISVPVAAR